LQLLRRNRIEHAAGVVLVHKDDRLAARFQQNSHQGMRLGDEAEVAFDAIPETRAE
jgi:multidrug resistance efflux pump